MDIGKVALVVLFALAPIVGIALGIGAPGLRARGPLFVAFFLTTAFCHAFKS